MTTFSLPSAALFDLLRDVREAASSADIVPMICGVMIHTATAANGKTVLVATATDRFMLLHGHVAIEYGELPGRVWLNNGQVAQLLAMLRPYTTRKRGAVSSTIVTVKDGGVRFEQVTLEGDDLGAIGVTFPLAEGDFPQFEKLIDGARNAEPSTDAVAIKGDLLIRIARIAARRGEPMRMRSRGVSKATIVEIGSDLLALAMPVRLDDRTRTLDIPVYPAPTMGDAPVERAA